MQLQTFEDIVRQCDTLAEGEGYRVVVLMRNGAEIRGAWHKHRGGHVQIDTGDHGDEDGPVFASIDAIDAIEFVPL